MPETKVYDKVWIAAEVRKQLKAAYPDCKFSVVVRHHSEIQVALMSTPFSPYTDGIGPKHEQLNHYYLDNYAEISEIRKTNLPGQGWEYWSLTPKAIEMFKKVTCIANQWNWDHSDSQSDYFDVNYYFMLEIGHWDKPFEVRS